MDEIEKQKTIRWLATWERASKELEELKKRKLQQMETNDVVESMSVHQAPGPTAVKNIMQRDSVVLAGWFTKIHLLQVQQRLDELEG